MKLNLTPIQIIGLILVVNGALIGSTAQLTDLFGPQVVKYIIAVASLGNSIFGGVITMLTGQGAQIKNVLAMPGVDKITVNANANPTLAAIAIDPTSDKIAPTAAALDKVTAIAKTVAAILMALMLTGLFTGDASAQIKVRLPDPLKLNQPAQPAAAPAPRTAADPLARVMDQLAAVQQKVVDGVVADIMAADADAASLTNPADPTSFKDPISHACYPAGIKFLQSLPVATAPTGEFILVQLFQKKRDFIAQIRAGLPVYLKLGCAPLLGDEAAIFTKLIGLVGVKVGLDALAPGLGLAMPVL
jgi:hypothetical protein